MKLITALLLFACPALYAAPHADTAAEKRHALERRDTVTVPGSTVTVTAAPHTVKVTSTVTDQVTLTIHSTEVVTSTKTLTQWTTTTLSSTWTADKLVQTTYTSYITKTKTVNVGTGTGTGGGSWNLNSNVPDNGSPTQTAATTTAVTYDQTNNQIT